MHRFFQSFRVNCIPLSEPTSFPNLDNPTYKIQAFITPLYYSDLSWPTLTPIRWVTWYKGVLYLKKWTVRVFRTEALQLASFPIS